MTLLRATLFAALTISNFISSAQETAIQNSIDVTFRALTELDLKAKECLLALDSNADSAQVCDNFMSAVDGELMANYLSECRRLKSWRDEFVTRSVAEDVNTSTGGVDDQEMLRRLVTIQFSCGENTLPTRTQYVVSAFNKLQNSVKRVESSAGTAASALSRQLSESRFNAIENQERQRLQNAVQGQQIRSQIETERQFEALQNELIRQQIRNTNRPY